MSPGASTRSKEMLICWINQRSVMVTLTLSSTRDYCTINYVELFNKIITKNITQKNNKLHISNISVKMNITAKLKHLDIIAQKSIIICITYSQTMRGEYVYGWVIYLDRVIWKCKKIVFDEIHQLEPSISLCSYWNISPNYK